MNRLEQRHLRADRSRGEHAERAADDAGLVGQDIAEQVFGHDHVEMGRPLDDLHRRIVDEHELELHIGISRRHFARDLTPQPRGGDHVGLVDDGQMFAPLAGQFEGQTQNPLDLLARVNASIVSGVPVLAASLRTAEVHASGQLAHAQEIGSAHDLGLQRRAAGQRVEHGQRAQVGVQSERLAHPEQSLLGPHLGRRVVVVLRVADRAEQHGVGTQTDGVRLGRIRVARRIDRAGADQRFLILENMSVLRGHPVQDLHRLAHDLGTDTVPGQKCNLQFHIFPIISIIYP